MVGMEEVVEKGGRGVICGEWRGRAERGGRERWGGGRKRERKGLSDAERVGSVKGKGAGG